MDLVLTSAKELLLSRPTILVESRPLLNLLLIKANDFLNRPTIIPFSRPPPSSSSSSCSHNNSHDLPPGIPPRPPTCWYNKLATYFRDRFCDTVPYTNRTRLLLFSPSFERWFGNCTFNYQEYDDILPPTHPYTRRAKLILDRFIHTAVPRAGLAKPLPYDWELIGQSSNNFYGVSLCGGKIIINTSMLEDSTTDAELAWLISHEVAHVIARHHAEDATKWLLLLLSHSILIPQFPLLGLLSGTLWAHFIRFPHHQRTELEADYIGLLLFASVGYDPREVTKMYDKSRQIPDKKKNRLIEDYFSSNPTYEKQVQVVSQAMEEALAIYRECIATGNGLKKDRNFLFSLLYLLFW